MKLSTDMRNICMHGTALFLWMSVIFLFSAMSGSSTQYNPPMWYFIERKGAHIFEYTVLMLLSVRFFFAVFPREKMHRVIALAGIFSWAYAATDELHQLFVPYRGAKITDVMIDGFGILLMACVIFAAFKYRGRHQKPLSKNTTKKRNKKQKA